MKKQVRPEVSDDLLRDVVAAYREKAVKELITRYDIKMTEVSRPAGAPAASSARVAASR
jgi:hypothetical protein